MRPSWRAATRGKKPSGGLEFAAWRNAVSGRRHQAEIVGKLDGPLRLNVLFRFDMLPITPESRSRARPRTGDDRSRPRQARAPSATPSPPPDSFATTHCSVAITAEKIETTGWTGATIALEAA